MRELAGQLRAFHDAVIGAAPLPRGLMRDGARGMDVYAHAYLARIGGVLAKDYPKLRVVLGERFDALVAPYLRAHPTRDPSLREAGAHLATFLRDEPYADLARLERARVEVFDGPDAAPLTRDQLAALAVEPSFPIMPLRLVPSSELLELAWNADAVWDALEDGREAPAWERRVRGVLVWRRDLVVIHRTLEPDEAVALRAMARGACVAEILEGLPDAERALELLARWVDAAIVEGAPSSEATGHREAPTLG